MSAPGRERGLYSEFLGPSNSHFKREATAGPHAILENAFQPAPLSLPAAAASLCKLLPGRVPIGTDAAGLLCHDSTQQGEEKHGNVESKQGTSRTGDRAVKPEPKLIAPYKTRRGEPPRPILLSRARRLFASQNLEQLLRQVNINYAAYGPEQDHHTGERAFLPLELFDDASFDTRSTTEWLQLGSDSTGQCALEAQGLRLIADGRGRFEKCVVVGWDSVQKRFQARWSDAPTTTSAAKAETDIALLSRVHLCFSGEDPFVFARRVAAAHERRRQCEGEIRRQLFVDAMPCDELQSLDTEQVNRVLALALNTKLLRQNALDTTSLLNEVNLDYARSMNLIIFDRAQARQGNQGDDRAGSRAAPKPALGPVPRTIIDIPSHDLPRHFSEFCFHTILSKPQVIQALVRVNQECLKLQDQSLLSTARGRAVKIDDFEQAQAAATAQTTHYLKETWTQAMKSAIKSSLRDVGKGWFNLEEQNREAYGFGKLHRFMMLVGFKAADSVRSLVQSSLQRFVAMIEEACAFSTSVHDTDRVTVTLQSGGAAASRRSEPGFSLFHASLIVRDNRVVYKRDATAFVSAPLQAFEKALSSVADIPHLERLVMEHLFEYNGDSKLACVQRGEPWVQELYERAKACLERAVQPLNEYLSKFQRFNAFLDLNVEEAVQRLASRPDLSLELVRREVQSHLDAVEELKQRVPLAMRLGLAEVSCEDVQRKLIAKRQQLAHELIHCYAGVVRTRCNDVMTTFRGVESQLKLVPTSIEELTQIRSYLQGVNGLVAAQNGAVAEIMEGFELLDIFRYRYSKEQFRLKWQVFGARKVLEEARAQQQQQLEEAKQLFLRKMRGEQEEFETELSTVQSKVDNFGQFGDLSSVNQMFERVTAVQAKLEELSARAREFSSRETLFEAPQTDYRRLGETSKAFEPYLQLWTTAHSWLENSQRWRTGPFLALDPRKVEEEVSLYGRTLGKASKHRLIKENAALAEIAERIKQQLDEFAPVLPLIAALRSPGMRERHWAELSRELNTALQPDEKTTLDHLTGELKLLQQLPAIVRVGDNASKEYQIESALDKMEEAWRTVDLDVTDYKETKTFVLRGTDEIVSLLDEHLVMTQAMQFSRYKKNFEERISSWDRKLRLVSDVLDVWMAVQRQWLALQPIFESPDINKQLPAEGKRFANVNKTWRLLMSQAHNNRNALSLCDSISLLGKLQEANKMLELVQKHLNEYLDKKRAAFARFYFLSNDELLQILSQSQDPQAVQPHLKKCFENIDRLEFSSAVGEERTIVAMLSAERERVALVQPLSSKGKPVENWLGEVEQEMQRTVRVMLTRAVADYENVPRAQWVRKWPGQCVLNGSQVQWTREVEAAILSQGHAGVVKFLAASKQSLLDMVALIRGKLSRIEQITMGALIVLDVHARDVVERLVNDKVSAITDFAWACQMRYYMEYATARQGDGGAQDAQGAPTVVQMVQSRFPYGNEYLGNTLRLVITPLTDRCYLTLMSALQLHLGGAPAGPAGTGKTETVKDLAKAVAKQCVVFNCSDGLDYLAMGKFFKGLASSGAWACFDEFNRIDVEVLSVVAQQIMTIWNAVRQNAERFVFEDAELPLNPTCSVFITMNPGYAGRTELPDNLKALFRPVAMMVPDYALIAEIMLYSFGFEDAKTLARKMVATFKLSSEQLSAQDHYDYGMRAVKTTITRAGILKQENQEANEAELVLRALRDVNVPKFVKDDLPLFEGIVSDLFPGVTKAENSYEELIDALKRSALAQGLQPVPSFIQKCIQLYETSVVRHGLMLVGPTGGGKTSSIRVLQDALASLHEQRGFRKTLSYTVNPKAVTMGQLYGEFDENTHEWTDGILASLVRNCVSDSRPFNQWIVFDGPVDALWIENMNTVLDDNKKLCLVSGEILKLTPAMTMIFEVEDLAVASPATVSRCGMVYLDPAALGVAPLVTSWLSKLPAPLHALISAPLQQLFDALLEPAIAFTRRNCPEPVPTVDLALAASMMALLNALLAPYKAASLALAAASGQLGAAAARESDSATGSSDEQQLAGLPSLIESLFVLALVWSVGASTNKAGRAKFDQYLRLQLTQRNSKTVLPAEGLVYDYCLDVETGRWLPWMASQPAFTFDPKTPFSEIIVPTADSVRYRFLLNALVTSNRHVLLTGSTGTGKTVNAQQFLSALPDQYAPLSVIFSAATTANQTQDLLFRKMEKRRKGVFGAPLGKRFVVLVDDLNMPARERYFAQPPIELLRQLLDHGGWYDRDALEFQQIADVTLVGAMGPPGGGRNPVTARFLRHFNQVAHADLDHDSLTLIFGTIARGCMAAAPDVVRHLSDALVAATVEVYNTIARELLPTPSKSHYTFNLRDLSKVFQGLLSANQRKLVDRASLLRLWVHENRRVFQDRLVNDTDRDWLDALLGRLMEKHFATKWDEVVTSERIVFGDFFGGAGLGAGGSSSGAAAATSGPIAGDVDGRSYEEVTDMSQLVRVMEDALNTYNEENSPMNLVLFLDAVEHVCRIARVLRQPQGNALLLGVGGSGRQSLTKLATYMCEFNLFRIEINKNYGRAEWREDLKRLLLGAGLKEEQTVFLFSETQIVHESFLEDINSILNSGDVPALYGPEDLDSIFAACKADCQKRNMPVTKLNVYSQFIARVRRNLHVVLCMSPLSAAFRTRLRMFPALVNCCTIDWFSAWPSEALLGVAQSAISDDSLKLGNVSAVAKMFEFVHLSVDKASITYREQLRRYNYVTPTSYLELISTFKALLKEKRDQLGGLLSKLQNGLFQLRTASEAVQQLQKDLREKQPILVQTQKEVEEMMVQIADDTKSAAVTKEVVERQEADATAKAAECKLIRDDAQADLDKALPLLDQAVECLNDLKKNDIDEVRSMKKPPSGVKLTMEAACIMLRKKPTMKGDPSQVGKKVADYWETAQKELLTNPKELLRILKEYDKDNIPEETIKKIQPYIAREDFQIKVIEKASKACTAIAMWVHAMFKYYGVSQEVEPKRAKLREAEASLAVVEAHLKEAKEKLAVVQERLRVLTERHEQAVAQQEALKKEVHMCQVKLERAQKLIGGLGGEGERWAQSVKSLNVSYDNVVGDVILASATMAYLGAFTADFRRDLTRSWQQQLSFVGLPSTESGSVRATLADPVQLREWHMCGLPTDSVSVENGIIISKARRWPLMIDPQGQAGKFIKALAAKKFEGELTVVKLTDKNMLRAMENAVRFGRWVLLENIAEEIDPAVEPLLVRQIIMVQGTPHIRLGDTNVPFNDNFRLFITTKLPNPHFAPELQVKVTLLNFTITPQGLEDQMLGTVVARENPELEQKKNELVIQNARMKAQLESIESQILKLLSETKGDILEDEALIETLSASKKTSAEIQDRVVESAQVEKEIDDSRRAYAPVAQRASTLFFCIADLAHADPMYQYSLQWFVQLFVNTIPSVPQADNLSDRLQLLSECFTRALYDSICRSLFEHHKLLFSFLLAVRVLQAEGRIGAKEWRFLVASSPPSRSLKNPAPAWLTDSTWAQIVALSDLEKFADFEVDFVEHLPLFRRYFDSATPHLERLPDKWEARLDGFLKLLVLKCLRPDKMSDAILSWVAANLGKEYTEFPPFSIQQSFAASTSSTPLIFILSRGADPAAELFAFAEDMGCSDKMKSISLGQGQGAVARKYIEEAMKSGGWVLLQNCHLAISWLPTLERLCEDIKPELVHANFRLWLTSLPTPKFPVSILQNGVKMTNEPPKGLRSNLMRSYLGFTDDALNDCKQPVAFKKLLYSLCLFHAVILDRKKFGPLGWNIPYEFTENDLQVCVTQLREFLNMYDEVPYEVIRFMTHDIHYGGRVTDDVDRRTIATILSDFIKPEVLRDDYAFTQSGKYKSLAVGSRQHYLDAIRALELVPQPEVFGMHENADITSARSATAAMFNTILALMPRAAAEDGRSSEDVVMQTAQQVLDSLPPNFDCEAISRNFPTVYTESMNTVLLQETIRYNRLLSMMRSTLADLLKALKGLMVMTEPLEKMATALFNNQVPEQWSSVAYPSLMPLATWVSDLHARLDFVQQWITKGTPAVFWISGFFFPQAFLTGALQNFARKHKCAIDAVSFSFHVLDSDAADIHRGPEDGIYVRGLFIEGARWDSASQCLADSRPKELFTSFPVIWLLPQVNRVPPHSDSVYTCPVYKITTRCGTLSTTGHSTNFVLNVELPTRDAPSKWIKAGVALFCALSY